MSNDESVGKMSGAEVSEAEKAPKGDDLALQQLGYEPQMDRKFSPLQLFASAFTVTNSWLGMAAGFATGIGAAGPAGVIYGLVLIFVLNLFVGAALGELVSAMPTSGGQYYWAMTLAPRRLSRASGYITGVCNIFAAYCITTSSSTAVSMWVFGCVKLAVPEFALADWHVYLGAVALNLLCAFVNLRGSLIARSVAVGFWISLFSCIALIVAIPVGAREHTDAKFIFATLKNSSGWSSDGMAFLVGLINANWSFGVLDSAAHLAEETPRPERNVPRAIMLTVLVGFATCFPFCCVVLYSMSDYDQVLNTATGVPLIELMYMAFDSKPKALAAASFVVCSYFASLIPQHAYQARTCWSFARDNGLPFSNFFAKIHHKTKVPLNAHIFSVAMVIVLALIYIASSTAFNSLITGVVTFPYATYIIPMASSLWRGADQPQGPFHLGKLGVVAKLVTLVFCMFTFIIYSFPFVMPATGSNMNYITVVYGVAVVYGLLDWFLRARYHFLSRSDAISAGITGT